MSASARAKAETAEFLPHAVMAEQALIGTMLIDKFWCAEAVKRCDPELFYDPFLRRVFDCICDMHLADERVTPFSIRARMSDDQALRQLDRAAHKGDYLACLAGLGSGFPQIDDYIDAMRKAAQRRQLLTMAGYSVEDEPDEVAAIEARSFAWINPSAVPPREWLYGRHLIRKFASATVAPGGVGKSLLITAEALAQATGRSFLGQSAPKPLRVWLWNLEDPTDEIRRRVLAVCLRYGITAGDLAGRLYISSGREQPCVIARSSPNGAIVAHPVVNKIIVELRDKQIDVLTIDPFVSCHRVQENDNGAIDAVAKEWGRVAEAANCGLDLVHHVRKIGEGQEITADDARGAGSLVNACRSVRVLNRMTKDEAERAGVDNPRSYFRVMTDKLNLAPPPDAAEWFSIESMNLGNGPPHDHVGVVVPWQWPDPFDGMSARDLFAIQKRIASGNWKESAQAKNWAGLVIAEHLNLDLKNRSAKSRCRRLLKLWVGSGALVIVRKQDETRHERPFIEVGQWAVE